MIQNVAQRHFKWFSQNEFVSQFTCLLPHFYYVKIHAPTYSQALENDDEQHFN